MNKLILIVLAALTSIFACQPKLEIEGAEDFPILAIAEHASDWTADVRETSGLALIEGSYWTHNDSGDDPKIYLMDMSTGEVERTIKIPGVQNIDWEEMTADSSYVYIGDFGNNIGKRKNLVIYRAPINRLDSLTKSDVGRIEFSYPDQTTFPGNYQHNHDAEAFIRYGEYIYIFSKNWLDGQCKLYRLPAVLGTYDAELLSTMDTKGVITGAVLHPDQETVTLIGYIPGDGFDPFIWQLNDYEGDDFFSGTQQRYNLDVRTQTEAIHVDGDDYLITAEAERTGLPQLYRVPISRE